MTKNVISYDSEINLIDLFKIIWNGKIKIITITIISFLIGFGYSMTPNSYIFSIVIKPIQVSDPALTQISTILKFLDINKILKKNEYEINNKIILSKFINELIDYEEFLFILKDNLKARDKENISKLPAKEQKQALFKYANLLKIIKPQNNETDYTLNLKWHNSKEAMDILKNTINLTRRNLEKLIYTELNSILEKEKKLKMIKNLQRLEHLSEQSSIAKQIGLSEQKEINVYFFDYESDISRDYLRGYKAIDKEIDIIKKRQTKSIDFIDKEFSLLKELKSDWIKYDINLTNSTLIRDNKSILIISALLGLVLSVFYVVIQYTTKSQTVFKKKVNKVTFK